jgi:hypothetical protein
MALPRPQVISIWTEYWQAPEKRLQLLETSLREDGTAVFRGGDFDRWDLTVKGGMLGAMRILMAVEEHGLGQQMVRFRVWPRYSSGGLAPVRWRSTRCTGSRRSAPARLSRM